MNARKLLASMLGLGLLSCIFAEGVDPPEPGVASEAFASYMVVFDVEVPEDPNGDENPDSTASN